MNLPVRMEANSGGRFQFRHKGIWHALVKIAKDLLTLKRQCYLLCSKWWVVFSEQMIWTGIPLHTHAKYHSLEIALATIISPDIRRIPFFTQSFTQVFAFHSLLKRIPDQTISRWTNVSRKDKVFRKKQNLNFRLLCWLKYSPVWILTVDDRIQQELEAWRKLGDYPSFIYRPLSGKVTLQCCTAFTCPSPPPR